jgi:predicted lactoylglutathione lyase
MSLIGYITLGTSDLERAGAFYDELLETLGARRVMTDERMLGWAIAPEDPMFSVIKPYDEAAATVGNGVMIALNVETPERVEAAYEKALALGAEDEGHPHDRGSSMGFYGGYFRDLDGNKLVVYCLGYEPPSAPAG